MADDDCLEDESSISLQKNLNKVNQEIGGASCASNLFAINICSP